MESWVMMKNACTVKITMKWLFFSEKIRREREKGGGAEKERRGGERERERERERAYVVLGKLHTDGPRLHALTELYRSKVGNKIL